MFLLSRDGVPFDNKYILWRDEKRGGWWAIYNDVTIEWLGSNTQAEAGDLPVTTAATLKRKWKAIHKSWRLHRFMLLE